MRGHSIYYDYDDDDNNDDGDDDDYLLLKSLTPHPTQYRSFRRQIHPGSLVHLLFSNG